MHDASSACVCGCDDPRGAAAHAVNAALRVDDVDRAIEAGLLDREVECTHCSDQCRARLHDARAARVAALAARERYRARAARLERAGGDVVGGRGVGVDGLARPAAGLGTGRRRTRQERAEHGRSESAERRDGPGLALRQPASAHGTEP